MTRMFILVLLLANLSNSFAQSPNAKIVEGFKTGNAALITPHLAKTLELILPGKEGTVSDAVAEKRLSDFFNKYPCSNFTSKHSGKSPSGSRYTIGILSTGGGTFRVYLLFGGTNAQQINEIRIESDE